MYSRIRDLRKNKNLTIEEIAEILEMSQSEYAKYETCEDIPTQVLIKLSQFYDVMVNYILGLSDDKNGL